ncbi:MAG: hypothetical protein RLZZ436_4226 [Planctomycetota bacterium]
MRIRFRDASDRGAVPLAGLRLLMQVSNYEVQVLLGDLSRFELVRELCGASDFLQLDSSLQLALVRAVFRPVITALQARVGTTVSISKIDFVQQFRPAHDDHRLVLEVTSGEDLLTSAVALIPAELRELALDFLAKIPVVNAVDVSRFEFAVTLMAGFVKIPLSVFRTLSEGDLLVMDAFNPGEASLDFVVGGCVVGGARLSENGVQMAAVRQGVFPRLQSGSSSEAEPSVLITVGLQFGRLNIAEIVQLRAGSNVPLKSYCNERVSLWADGLQLGFGEVVVHQRGVAVRLEQIRRADSSSIL